MKLCPECDFIYEDYQSVCDMDGKELVFEPTLTKFPGNSHIRSNVPLTRTRFLRSQNMAVTAMAAVVLVATLFLVYYVLTQRASSAKPAVAPTSTSNPVWPIPKESVSPAALATPVASRSTQFEGSELESADSQPATADSTLRAERQPLQDSISPNDKSAAVAKATPSLSITALPRVKALPGLKPLPKLAERNATRKPNQRTRSQIVSVRPKKESRVGSFLKKTARVLKKPFER